MWAKNAKLPAGNLGGFLTSVKKLAKLPKCNLWTFWFLRLMVEYGAGGGVERFAGVVEAEGGDAGGKLARPE